jgi:hypothetical protein
MKDLEKIKELLEKYFNGDTSLEEEEILHSFFTRQEVPANLKAEAGLFGYFNRERSGSLPGDLEQKLERKIAGSDPGLRKPGFRLSYYWISGIAAAVLILAGIFIDLQIRKNSSLIVRKDTFEDPYLAYVEAKKALYMVSEQMNAATEPLKNIEKLDAGVNYMHPVFSFGTGIQYMEKFSRIEKTRKLISK